MLWAGLRVAMSITHVVGQISPWPARKVTENGGFYQFMFFFATGLIHFKKRLVKTFTVQISSFKLRILGAKLGEPFLGILIFSFHFPYFSSF